eukprot:s284_g6.t1
MFKVFNVLTQQSEKYRPRHFETSRHIFGLGNKEAQVRPADLEDGSELWQAKSDDQNFIYNAFRVEADLNVRPSKVPSQLIEAGLS